MTKRLTIAVLIATVASRLLLPLVALCDESFKNVFAEQSTPRGSDNPRTVPPGVIASLPRGLSLEIDETKAVAAAAKYEVTVYTASWCGPCHSMKQRVGNGNEQLSIKWVESKPPSGIAETYPTICWNDASGTLRYVAGVRTIEQIIQLIERNNPPIAVTGNASEAQVAGAAVGGSIRGGQLIEVALDWWRQHIGEGVKVSGGWSRNGAQTLPLLRMKEWTPNAIYGTHGEFEIIANGSRLPVQSAVLGYKLANGRLKLNAETELDAEILNIGNTPQSVASAEPVGVSPMLILSVLSTVWQLLHPQADLQLPGRVTCDAVMSDGVLLVTFSERPSIRLVMLFTFNLGVESVRIARESVVVKFSGSRWIKERTFEVRE